MTFSCFFFKPEFHDVILDKCRYLSHSTSGSETCSVGPDSEKNRYLHISEKNLKQSYNVHLNFVNYFLGPVLGHYPDPK
jgi:hypothetical protein